MRRRHALIVLAAGGLFLGGHTPYGQWVAYRQKHLLIGAHRKDLPGYEMAKTVAEQLQLHLPESRARVARGRAPSRLASLLATDQLHVALLDPPTIRAMRAAEGVFSAYGRLDLRIIANIESWSLVAVAKFPHAHAWLVAAAIEEMAGLQDPAGIPVHPGAMAFRQGAPKPS